MSHSYNTKDVAAARRLIDQFSDKADELRDDRGNLVSVAVVARHPGQRRTVRGMRLRDQWEDCLVGDCVFNLPAPGNLNLFRLPIREPAGEV